MNTRNLSFFWILTILITSGCGSNNASDNPAAKNPDELAIVADKLVDESKVPKSCGNGGITTGAVLAVNDEYQLRTGAGAKFDKIKNQKASEVLGGAHFHVVDKSTTVQQICREVSWSQVKIVEPDWLNQVQGWVPNSNLREIETDEGGRRLYTEKDIYWDDDTERFKTQVTAAVNKISRENDRCSTIDPSSIARSPSRSKPGKPVFFVTCGKGASAFNVWFEPSDIGSGRTFAATQNIGQAQAIQACKSAAMDAATHPSTVDFSSILDASFHPHASGRSRVLSTFTAKNSFGLELKFRISCLFEGNVLEETLIGESA